MAQNNCWNSDFEVFHIIIEKSEYPTQANMPINGHIGITLKKKLVIKAIKIQFKGRGVYRENEKEIEQVYVNNHFNLLDRIPGQPEPASFSWSANFPYSLPFNFVFPSVCPSSYESPMGYVRYWLRCTVVLDDPQNTEYMIKKGLNVIAWRGTSSLDDSSHPVGDSQNATFGKCCCKGKISADVRLFKSTFAPGEIVYGSLIINNQHPKSMLEQIEVKLIDSIKRPNSPFDNPGRVLCTRKLKMSDCSAKGITETEDIKVIEIPSVIPTTRIPIYIMSESHIEKETTLRHSESKHFNGNACAESQSFLNIEYEIHIVVAGNIVLRLPITVAALQTQGSDIAYQPFVGGPQDITEPEEKNIQKLNRFEFTPTYPCLKPSAVTTK